MNATATTLLRGTAWCARGARALRRAAAQAPAARQAALVVVPTRRARTFAPAARALRRTDAETDDEFLTMTDADVNRGSRLAQQVRANPPRLLRTRRVRRDSGSSSRRRPNG